MLSSHINCSCRLSSSGIFSCHLSRLRLRIVYLSTVQLIKSDYSKFPVTLNVKPPASHCHMAYCQQMSNSCHLSCYTPASPCHLSPLHPTVICHPCIPLSSVTPASHPPVICHTINARQFLSPVMLHLLDCPIRYLPCSQHISNSFHLSCYISCVSSCHLS